MQEINLFNSLIIEQRTINRFFFFLKSLDSMFRLRIKEILGGLVWESSI